MNRLILFFLFILPAYCLHAQSYEESMSKAFSLWENDREEQAIALFQRIAQAETEKWLPSYYAANIDIVHSIKNGQSETVQSHLDRARKNLDMAAERSPNNSEITTLDGLYYTAYVSINPAVYGMKYSNKIMALHEKAVELDPKNPRAHMNLIEYEMGYARFMGEDMTPFCTMMEQVLPMFDEQDTSIAFLPKYGKERALEIVNSCDDGRE
jgi:tetratricopeptide (TPR) repeat protein